MKPENQQRMFDALRKIARDFEPSERVMKNAERDWGLSPIPSQAHAHKHPIAEAAEMGAKNIIAIDTSDESVSTLLETLRGSSVPEPDNGVNGNSVSLPKATAAVSQTKEG